MPYVLDDTEVNVPVFGDLLSEAVASHAIEVVSRQPVRRRKPRRLTISSRLRLVQDPDVKIMIAELLRRVQASSGTRRPAFRPIALQSKKYMVLPVGTVQAANNEEGTDAAPALRGTARPPK